MSRLRTHLELGRVSNLPTVWSNVLCAAVLCGSAPGIAWLYALVAFSLFYTAGMYLNDACDAGFDAQHRPERPIPSGRITLARVRQASVLLFVLAFLFLGLASATVATFPRPSLQGWLLSAVFLLTMIVLYDLYHKDNPASPLLMALCRAAVFSTTALLLSDRLNPMIWVAIGLITSWLIGLTWAAKQERSARLTRHWPYLCLCLPLLTGIAMAFDSGSMPMILPLMALAATMMIAYRRLDSGVSGAIGATIGLLIASISLIDALLIASQGGALPWSLVALGCFATTLLAQRIVSGT